MRILIGHLDHALPPFDTERFDVRVVSASADGQRPPASIAEMQAQCPPGWKPDIYYHAGLVHFPIPTDIEDFDGLTVTHVQDWHRGGRALWAAAGFFDCIATERNACALLKAGGYENARFARFWGVNPELHRVLPGVERDIDVLFIGSLHNAVWQERNRWVARLARLSDRYKVVVAVGHYGEDYVRLTNRAKIVFNRSVNGCTNQRAYDGPACGALVFNEEENDETREIFADGVHCVYYNSENFEALLERYLTHEDARARIAEAGRQKALAEHTETIHTNALFALFEESLPLRGYRPLARKPRAERNARKAFQIFCCSRPVAAETALTLLDEAEQEGAERAALLEARAALTGWVAHYTPEPEKIRLLGSAIAYARQAVRAAPTSAVAPLSLAFLLLERAEAAPGSHVVGKNDIAEAAVALSTAAERCEEARGQGAENTESIEGFLYPRWNDGFDYGVERAYLELCVTIGGHAAWGQELREVISWRCRSLLSDLALANEQREEAFRQARAAAIWKGPMQGEALLRLGRCAAMNGALDTAEFIYEEGLDRLPLSVEAWPELAAVRMALGQREQAEAFVQDCLKIIQAAPAFAAIKPALLATLGA